MRGYRYRTLYHSDIKRALEDEYSKDRAKDILTSYPARELITALYEDRDIVVREYYKKEELKWYNILMRFTFPLLLVFVVITWILFALRWCVTGIPIGFKHGSWGSNLFEKWNELGRFKL